MQGEVNDDDEDDEDVLLVSDWDQDQDGGGMLDDCNDEVVRPSSNRGDHANTDQAIRSTVDTTAAAGNHEDKDADEDVLLVDDYNPDVEEEVEFEVMSSPVANGGGNTGTQEVRHVRE